MERGQSKTGRPTRRPNQLIRGPSQRARISKRPRSSAEAGSWAGSAAGAGVVEKQAGGVPARSSEAGKHPRACRDQAWHGGHSRPRRLSADAGRRPPGLAGRRAHGGVAGARGGGVGGGVRGAARRGAPPPAAARARPAQGRVAPLLRRPMRGTPPASVCPSRPGRQGQSATSGARGASWQPLHPARPRKPGPLSPYRPAPLAVGLAQTVPSRPAIDSDSARQPPMPCLVSCLGRHRAPQSTLVQGRIRRGYTVVTTEVKAARLRKVRPSAVACSGVCQRTEGADGPSGGSVRVSCERCGPLYRIRYATSLIVSAARHWSSISQGAFHLLVPCCFFCRGLLKQRLSLGAPLPCCYLPCC